jgi:hypothetical protein
MKYIVPFSKTVFGAVFLFSFVFAGGALMFEQFNIVALLILAIGAFISFKVMMSGWRSYTALTGTYAERKKKADLVAEKIRAKGELRVMRSKTKAAKTKIDLENKKDALDKRLKGFKDDFVDCQKFGIKVGFLEALTNKLRPGTADALASARQAELDQLKKKEQEQQKEREERKRQRDEKREIRYRRMQEKEEKEKRRLQAQARKKEALIEQFENEVDTSVISSFKEGEACIGMPIEMMDFMLGAKFEKKESASASKTQLRCKYGRGEKNQRGNYTYKLEAVFENGFLKSYKQL